MPGKKTNTQKNGHAHDQWQERKHAANAETKHGTLKRKRGSRQE